MALKTRSVQATEPDPRPFSSVDYVDVRNNTAMRMENKSGESGDRKGSPVQGSEGRLRERAEKEGAVEGGPLPIRVSPQAFNHPIKRIFTYVN